MSNRTSMAQISAIGNLYRSGHSNRQIAKILDLNRETVGKYVAAFKAAGNQNQPNPLQRYPAELANRVGRRNER